METRYKSRSVVMLTKLFVCSTFKAINCILPMKGKNDIASKILYDFGSKNITFFSSLVGNGD